MAFARCPNCNRAIRYKVIPASNTAWLKQLARAVGQGETAVFYCINCWLVPEVGDRVAVHEPGEAAEHIRRGDVGTVQEIEREGSPYAQYTVAGANDRGAWRERFMRWQIQAAEFDPTETLIVPFTNGEK